jgi:hypothetical protein
MKKFTYSWFIGLALLFWAGNANSQISLVGSDEGTSTNSTLTLDKPGGVIAGDFMIVNITQGEEDGSALSGATLAGWTVIDSRTLGTNGSLSWWGTVLYRIADASDVVAADYDFVLDADVDNASGNISVFRGVDNANPFDVVPGTINVVNTDDLSATAVTTVSANTAIVMLGMIADNRNSSSWNTTSPGSLDELEDQENGSGDAETSASSAWATKASIGTTGTGTAELENNENDFNGSIIIALKSITFVPNLWSTSGDGPIRSFTVNPVSGVIMAGPTQVLASPTLYTAALGRMNPNLNDVDGCLYYLNRDGNGDGSVNVYSVRPDGTGNGLRGTIDMNGVSNTSIAFVRLAFNAAGRGFIIAGEGSNIYIASFQGNGVNPISSINNYGNVVLTVAAPGSAAEFQNGDLAISGTGVLYALANVTDGDTYVYTLNSLTTPTTLTRKWTVQQGGNQFSGSVNGLAWTSSGSLHFSTSTGIYFIDQFTANTVSGTVQATLVANSGGLGLTDLASSAFPTQSTLPVTLVDFAGSLRNNVTTLNWTAENMTNFDRFEIERSVDGSNYTSVGAKAVNGNVTARTSYSHLDNLAGVSGNVFYYRLKMVDADAQFKYSNVILVRKDVKALSGIVVNPNPVRGDNATLRFDASASMQVDIRIIDMSGKLMLRQQNQVYEGTNSVSITNLGRLQPGSYILQMLENGNVHNTKIIVAH